MNPIIRHKYTCDPTAIVVDETVYLYTGHDEAPPGGNDYVMNEWLVFSSKDLINWTEHAIPLRAKDFRWASGDAYASKVVTKDGKYYWFVSVTHAQHKGKAIGVAVSTSPTGPFKDAIGHALITHDMLPVTKSEKANLDPTVLIDDDGQVYMFWGNGICYYAKVKATMDALASEVKTVDLQFFEEGSCLHKRNGWYYLSYGYGMPEKVAYAMSRNIEGPWDYKGILNEIAGNCETNRPCIIDFKGQSYFIYHNGALPGGGSHRRSICVDHLHYNADDTMKRVVMSSEGVERFV
jgi:beta-xylosidase